MRTITTTPNRLIEAPGPSRNGHRGAGGGWGGVRGGLLGGCADARPSGLPSPGPRPEFIVIELSLSHFADDA